MLLWSDLQGQVLRARFRNLQDADICRGNADGEGGEGEGEAGGHSSVIELAIAGAKELVRLLNCSVDPSLHSRWCSTPHFLIEPLDTQPIPPDTICYLRKDILT